MTQPGVEQQQRANSDRPGSSEISIYEIRIEHPEGFGGHEFCHESDTDLFKCELCGRYEFAVRDETGEIEPCSGTMTPERVVRCPHIGCYVTTKYEAEMDQHVLTCPPVNRPWETASDRVAAVSREIVTTLNDPYAEANRRAWANITRPVDTDPRVFP